MVFGPFFWRINVWQWPHETSNALIYLVFLFAHWLILFSNSKVSKCLEKYIIQYIRNIYRGLKCIKLLFVLVTFQQSLTIWQQMLFVHQGHCYFPWTLKVFIWIWGFLSIKKKKNQNLSLYFTSAHVYLC